MSIIVYRAGRAAMRCWCEVFLCGDDRGHLAAVAELALDEITRVERMLSRFDPASEVSRLNHASIDSPFRVSPELFAILNDCRDGWRRTDGAFDVTVGSLAKPGMFLNAGLLHFTDISPTSPNAEARRPKQTPGFERWQAIHLDATEHTIKRSLKGITFDFGGYGKGYAIDCALAITQRHGITAACLHAGTSSIVASGPPPDAAGWSIAIRHPDEETRTVTEWLLCHSGMSTSAVPLVLCAGLPTPHSPLTEGLRLENNAVEQQQGDLRSVASAGSGDPRTTDRHDIIDPTRNAALTHPASCTVMATTAAIAEVWSTALLVHGERIASTNDAIRVLWQRFADGSWVTSPRQNDAS